MRLRIDSPKWRSAEFLRTLLIKDERVKSLVGTHIYPISAPPTEGDYIIITRTSYATKETKQGIYEVSCNVMIEAYSDHYDRGLEIAEAVDDCFARLRADAFGTNEVTMHIEAAAEQRDEQKYIQIVEYVIK